jgi:hypothetical protein
LGSLKQLDETHFLWLLDEADIPRATDISRKAGVLVKWPLDE